MEVVPEVNAGDVRTREQRCPLDEVVDTFVVQSSLEEEPERLIG